MILKVFSCELIMSKDSDVSNPPHPVSHVLVWRIWGALHFHGDTRTESTPLRYVTFLGFLVWPTATPSVQASPFCEQHLLTWSVMQSRVHLVLRHKHALLHCCRLMLLEKKRIKKKKHYLNYNITPCWTKAGSTPSSAALQRNVPL